jgi:hypothetical protein
LKGGCDAQRRRDHLPRHRRQADPAAITCDKCGRSGQYRIDRLYGIDAKLSDWSDEIMADCPRKRRANLYDQCGAGCPDLPKVV